MGENNTVVNACTLYGHLPQYCSHPSVHVLVNEPRQPGKDDKFCLDLISLDANR